ncbi:MAG: hypothetical protein SWZ49_12320 [Cyanobacteriota bacterium]|nr:hypothetical protein [Cyanobacteriota bacterium]
MLRWKQEVEVVRVKCLTCPYFTEQQAIELYKMCQNLTSMYLPVNLVTIDERTQSIYILAGEELEVLINKKGEVAIL